jgi:hypothetical protein
LKCPNGSCEPILDIYVPKDFQSYKDFFNPMRFDPYNHSLKIWKSIGTPTPKVGTDFSYILGSMRCDSRASLLVCTLASLYFGHEPKEFLKVFFATCF